MKITLELLKEIAEGHYFSVSDDTIREMARELIEWRELVIDSQLDGDVYISIERWIDKIRLEIERGQG